MKKFLSMAALLVSMTAAAYTTTTSPDLHVWVEIPEIVADGVTVNYINVYQHDDQDLIYTSFNMELILPEGFRVNKVREGRSEVNDIKMTERADVTHSIACNLLDGVDLRIIAYSTVNADLFQDDLEGNPLDHLFTVGLIAEPTLTSGEHTLELTGVKFAMSNGDATVPADDSVTYTFMVNNPVTGITETEAVSGDSPEVYYDLQGRRVDPASVHGAIIVKNGGKVLVK